MTNVLIGLATVALIGGLLLGFFNKDKKEDVKVDDSDVVDYTDQEEFEDVSPDESDDVEEEDSQSNNSDSEPEDFHGDVDYDVPDKADKQKVDKDKLAPSYDDVFGKEQVKQSREVVEKFMKSYYDLDGDYPTESIENAKKYMSDDLYKQAIESPEEPTHDYFSRNLISLEISESKNISEGDKNSSIPYIVHAEGEFKDINGNNKEQVNDIYNIIVEENGDGKFEVIVVSLNQPF